MDKAGGYIYFIDPESPLSAKQYRILFERGTVDQVRSIAKKLKVADINKPKNVLKTNIVGILAGMGLSEPIKAMKIADAKNSNAIFSVPTNGNKNLFAPINKNKNKNIFDIPINKNKNIFDIPINKNKNLIGTPVINMKNAQLSSNSESEPFTLGKPIVKAPRGLSETSVTNKLNNISNSLSYISERAE